MSALNNTAPRFRNQQAAPQLPPVLPPGFTPTLDVPPRLANIVTPVATPLATPLAPPPPPPLHASPSNGNLHVAFKNSGSHTLGPTFSDEEDGDDSDFIAAKMAALGIDRGGRRSHSFHYTSQRGRTLSTQSSSTDLQRKVQAQQQLLQLQILKQQQQQAAAAQQAAAIQAVLLQNAASDPQQLRDAMALLDLQRAQMNANALAQSNAAAALQQRAAAMNAQSYQQALQQQILALQAQYAAVTGGQVVGHPSQRHTIASQLEAGTLRRERERERERSRSRPMSPLNDQQLRAAFENAPNAPMISPPIDSATGVGWTSCSRKGSMSAGEWSWNAPPRTSSTSTIASSRASSPVTATCPQQPLGRFARTRQDLAAAQAAAPGAPPLTALLSRYRQIDDDNESALSLSETLANSPTSEHPSHVNRFSSGSSSTQSSQNTRKWSVESRFSTMSTASERKWSVESRKVSSESDHTIKEPATYFDWGYHAPAPRSHSFSSPQLSPNKFASRVPVVEPTPVSNVMRQPYGPPHSADELSNKNFASSVRKKVSLNLGMLSRRTSGIETEA